jgi:hypothetical protein
MESGTCPTVSQWLHAIDVDATATSLSLGGGHDLIGQGGSHQAPDEGGLRWWIRGVDGTWGRHSYAQLKDWAMGDGESLLVVQGSFDAAAIQTFKASVAAPNAAK